MSSGKLRIEREGPIGYVVLDNPARRNAISAGMWRSFPVLLEELGRDPSVRCIVLRGEGDIAFAAGADISEFESNRASDDGVRSYEAATSAAHHALESTLKPVIAQIRGFCIGGGLAVALSCDLRYCADDSQFAIPAARLGLGYGIHGHRRLVATVGHAQAREIMFSARRYDAAGALELGLVNRVLPATELDAWVRALAHDLAANAPLTQAASKAAINAAIAEQGDYEQCEALIKRCMASADYREGRSAFMEKRKPKFEGR
ncbi:MAG: enoyl-CoA hydratase/isomerase family protein [Proteobacteria bacterium]|nr:enoyl-CoA hydratase/isomerase family protein [Pseudomonadota bacterium]